MGAAAAAGLAAGPVRAAAPAVRAKGSLDDIEHVVILMQENRSFDHYFGALRGVRGFGDPRPLALPNGDPVWSQRQRPKDGGAVIEPFRLDTRTSAAGCLQSLDHSWRGSYDRWKHYDAWAPAKGPMTMGHLTREDLPYYYALADAFTICDAYHCSIHGPTGPNRLYLFSGSNGTSVGTGGVHSVTNGGCDDNPGADMAKDDPKFAGFGWTPYALRLEQAGVSWRVYQEYDNFSDNPLGYFKAFRKLDRASSLYRRGRAWVDGSTPENAAASEGEHLVRAFAADVAADRLPAVSWVVASQKLSEHPDAPPAYGQTLTARLVAALASNPQVWRKTVLILNYDENDGFFDHQPPPIPAIRPDMGASTIETAGETYGTEPIGLGPRVPCLVISPWTRGGWVNSEVFDHTSVIRFLERRFGVAEPNISPWRRAVCGDLTSAFDFDVSDAARRDVSWLAALPETGGYAEASRAACRLPPARRPTTLVRARQEPGQRLARPLPYRLDVAAEHRGEGLALTFVNTGAAAAVFTVHAPAPNAGVWTYTVGPGATLPATFAATSGQSAYDLTVRGPDGFHRRFQGAWSAAAPPEAALVTDARTLSLRLSNPGPAGCIVALTGAAGRAGPRPQRLALAPGETRTLSWPAAAPAARWYDLTLRLPGDPAYSRRLAGQAWLPSPGVTEPMTARA